MTARHPRLRVRAGGILLVALLLAADPAAAAAGPAGDGLTAERPRNVLLITLDTTRADHLSCYGYPLVTSPRIDALAAGGVRFSQASAVVPLTGPGHASILSGLYPRDHGAIRNGVAMAEEVPTLATMLAARGLRTAAFVSGWTLRGQLTGLSRGFDLYDDEMTDRYKVVNNQRPGDETADRAVAWLEQAGPGPFFLWVHFFDPHDPFKNHGLEIRAAGGGGPETSRPDHPADYDQEIAFADRQVGRVLDALEAAGRTDETLIVLTADHGEAFGEHGEKGHGRNLYQATQSVPLILSHPVLGPAGVSSLPVSVLDVTPTVLDLLDMPPVPGSEGIPLAQALQSPGSFAAREIYQETFHGARKGIWKIFAPKLTGDPIMVAVRRGGWKAILDPESGDMQLYDLASDPEESQDLASELTVRASRYRPLLAAHADRAWRAPETETAVSDEDRERLESLGYID
jgi:arylsulfatase A-like enzyme